MDCTRPPANGHGVHLVGGVQHRRSNSYGVRRQSAQQGDPLVDMWVTVITVWWVCCALFWAALGAVAVELKVCVRVGEYLVNIAQPAQKRVTGGRWRLVTHASCVNYEVGVVSVQNCASIMHVMDPPKHRRHSRITPVVVFLSSQTSRPDGARPAPRASMAAHSVATTKKNGLEAVQLTHSSGASALVYVYGAHLASWQTADGDEQVRSRPPPPSLLST